MSANTDYYIQNLNASPSQFIQTATRNTSPPQRHKSEINIEIQDGFVSQTGHDDTDDYTRRIIDDAERYYVTARSRHTALFYDVVRGGHVRQVERVVKTLRTEQVSSGCYIYVIVNK